MRKKWHIRSRVLGSLLALTSAMLLVVALAFNLSVQGYIRAQVSTYLGNELARAEADRMGAGREPNVGPRSEGHTARPVGSQDSAILLDKDGNLLDIISGSETTAGQIAAYCRNLGISNGIQNAITTIDGNTYTMTAVPDPMDSNNFLLVYVDITSTMELTQKINLVMVIVILAAILISVLVSRRFAKSLAEPVQSLCDFAGEIGKGNLTTRELSFRDIEFEQLADSMNRMATELQEEKLRQETFFQNVSHELRTPLTSIRGNAEGIDYGIIEPKTAGKVILAESDKLGGMIEDLLYLSRVGKVVPEDKPEQMDLRDVLSLCVSELRTEAEGKGIAFRFDFDDAPVLFSIREKDAQQLFRNLISNAVRYAKTELLLSCHTDERGIGISVADDGEGIAPDDLPHVFERFYKGKGGKHGIGLSISKSVADMYQGEVMVRNDSGAVFEVRFPA